MAYDPRIEILARIREVIAIHAHIAPRACHIEWNAEWDHASEDYLCDVRDEVEAMLHAVEAA